MNNLPTFDTVLAASRRLNGVVNNTAVATSRTLNRRCGAEIFLKCENFQRIGAFKFRGAYNAMAQLTAAEKRKGVITHSSGNHAQAVALVGSLLNISTTIVMPDNAPATKRMATEAYGARIIEYDPEITTREELSHSIKEKEGQILIPPYDHPEIVAGQGTAALELLDKVKSLDYVITPCGGGGLLSGSALAAKGRNPGCKVIGIEPELADDATRSFRTGKLHTVKNPPTIADGTRTPSLGKITFPLILNNVDDMITVTEDAIIEAVCFLLFRMKLVVEPSGALGVAALLSGALKVGGRVGIILSGGNVDNNTLQNIIALN